MLRGGGYLASYQRNRVLPIFAINAFLVVFYAAQKILFGEEVTVPNIALSFFYGGNVVTFGWYLLCIMVFYELFYASAKFFGKHICLAITVMTLMYIALAMMLKMSGWWYMSCLAFPSGVIFAHYKKDIDAVICHHTALVLFLGLLLYLGSFFFLFAADGEHSCLANIPHSLLLRRLVISVHGVFFVLVVIGGLIWLGNARVLSSGVAKKLSLIYLEIYVMQGFVFALLRNSWWSVDNDCLYAVFSVLLTLALATAMRPVFQKIISWVKIPKGRA